MNCRVDCKVIQLLSYVVLSCFVSGICQGAEFPTPKLSDVVPGGIAGNLVVCGGGKLPEEVYERFYELAGKENSQLVYIPTASSRADDSNHAETLELWKRRGFEQVNVLHTTDRAIADSLEFATPLKTATAVWIGGGQQSRLAKAYSGTLVEKELQELLKRGGVIGGTSAGAAIQSRLMIASVNPDAVLMQGLDLIPGAVVDQHFQARKRIPRLTSVLEKHHGYFGLGIDEGTALVVQGRRMEVLGDSSVTVCLSKSSQRDAKQYELKSGDRADLPALQRAAIARASTPFLTAEVPVPNVSHGSLMIVGGGGMTKEMWAEFVELAGGTQARIVILPSASGNPRTEKHPLEKLLKSKGVASVTVYHASDRTAANDPDALQVVNEATGMWIDGGRQWRLVDLYAGTAAELAFHDILKRGGVIAGSSAGATIQGDYLVRGNPLGNREMMAEGYERGFGFLPGTAIDQHFTQRNRLPDMKDLKQTFPQLHGIGIDETTAIVVQKSTARVIGENDVYFFSPSKATPSKTGTKVSPGSEYRFQ